MLELQELADSGSPMQRSTNAIRKNTRAFVAPAPASR